MTSGGASTPSGLFYCPSDQKVYVNTTFFEDLKSKFGQDGGDFTVAHIVTHEIHYHVQTISEHFCKRWIDEKEANKLSVVLRITNRYYIGIWIHLNEV